MISAQHASAPATQWSAQPYCPTTAHRSPPAYQPYGPVNKTSKAKAPAERGTVCRNALVQAPLCLTWRYLAVPGYLADYLGRNLDETWNPRILISPDAR